jgi:hypothetical protein
MDKRVTKGTPQQWQALAKKLRGTKFKLPDNGGSFVWHGGIGL